MLEKFVATGPNGQVIAFAHVSSDDEITSESDAIVVKLSETDQVGLAEIEKLAKLIEAKDDLGDILEAGIEKLKAMAVLISTTNAILNSDENAELKLQKLKETNKRASGLTKVSEILIDKMKSVVVAP